MYKKIYSLLASLILLTACSEEILQDNNNPVVKGEEVTMSFTLDIPSASMLSKSTEMPEDENGEPIVSGLKLYVFDGNKDFLDVIVPSVNGVNYTATIPLETRVIHFISNYDDVDNKLTKTALTGKTEEYILSLYTNEYIFWAVKRFQSQPPSNLDKITLYRNWAKVSVVNNAALSGKQILSNVRYFVYRTAQVSSIVQEELDKINMPSITPFPYGNLPNAMPATGKNGSIEVKNNEDNFAYLFENDNSVSGNATYVIIEANYMDDLTPTYYKIDFSNKTGDVMELYDILRNKWYQITIQGVAGPGCTFAEVIDPDKVPDNNITASAQLNDYPKISFGDESLEVSGTTFLFTEPEGAVFDMTAIFKESNIPNLDKLKIVQNRADLENVLLYGDDEPETLALSVTNNVPTIGFATISGDVKGVQGSSKKGHFYVVGGALQRKITIIVQKAYDFINFTLTKADAAVGSDVTAHFELPANIEKSIFPLEVSFETKKLYSAEDGIRIEHVGSGYRYVYTVKEYNEAGYNVSFKTNEKNATEMVYLTAKYFNQAEAQLRSGAPLYNFSDVTVSNPYYGVGEDVTLDISFPSGTQLPVTVYITAPTLDGPTMYTFNSGEGLTKQLHYTTNVADAAGSVTVSAEDYVTETRQITSRILDFENVTVPNSYYGVGESFQVKFNVPADAKFPVDVTITASNMNGTKTITVENAGEYTFDLTTNVANSAGSITLSAEGYNNAKKDYVCMAKKGTVVLGNAGGFKYKQTMSSAKNMPKDTKITTNNSSVSVKAIANGQYEVTINNDINVGTSVTITADSPGDAWLDKDATHTVLQMLQKENITVK
ncbi:hypothetical protein LJC39_02590 [Parabacteroides sp. OttesenSCG-928-B22]|nr:hypothetical protein [Parabacteroides sp. OttesenSCG-928-B22]